MPEVEWASRWRWNRIRKKRDFSYKIFNKIINGIEISFKKKYI